MIILPDRNIPRAKFLMPVSDKEWREPSLTLSKDIFGNPSVKTMFKINAKSNDGVIIWTGWFDDRADFDAFLYAIALGTLIQERALWDLPTPSWQPYLGELISYEFATVSFLTGSPGSVSSYSVPTDWNSSDNNVQAIGGGGGGGAICISGAQATGGGGGAWNKTNNITLIPNSTAYYRIGAGASAVTSYTSSSARTGNVGGDTWFSVNNVAPTGTSQGVLAKGGSGGNAGTGSIAGVSGGIGSSGIGNSSFDGGGSGSSLANSVATGGGGAAGPNGAGGTSASGSSIGVGTAGGTGDNGTGGAGSAGNPYTNTGGSSSAGGNGSEIQASPGYGSGGGSGGYKTNSAPFSPSFTGAGGSYGGGTGGAGNVAGYQSNVGAGGQGLIVVTYTPLNVDNNGMLGFGFL